MTQLLKKDVAFKWTESQEDAFNALKTALTTEPILQYPDFSQPFNLTTDASGYAMGGVLSQGPIRKDCIRLEIAKPRRTKLLHDRKRMSSNSLQRNALPTVFIWKKIYYYNLLKWSPLLGNLHIWSF